MGKVKAVGRDTTQSNSSKAAKSKSPQKQAKVKRNADHRLSDDDMEPQQPAMASLKPDADWREQPAADAAVLAADVAHGDVETAPNLASDGAINGIDGPTLGEQAVAAHGNTAAAAMDLDGPTGGAGQGQAPQTEGPLTGASAESVVMLLRQAIKGEDGQLLERCLSVGNERVIKATVRQLTSREVGPLIQALAVKLQSLRPGSRTALKWLKHTLNMHVGFIAASPGLQESLQGMYGVIETRLQCFPALLSLSGRMNLLMAQVPEGAADQTAQLFKMPMTYHEETDDEAEPVAEDPFAPKLERNDDGDDGSAGEGAGAAACMSGDDMSEEESSEEDMED